MVQMTGAFNILNFYWLDNKDNKFGSALRKCLAQKLGNIMINRKLQQIDASCNIACIKRTSLLTMTGYSKSLLFDSFLHCISEK